MSEVTKPLALDETVQRIAEALETLVEKKLTMTISASAVDGASVTGQLIKVIDVSSGLIFKQFNYSGQPETFDIPYGLSYRVEAAVTLEDHYCDDKPSGVATANVLATLSYKTIASITTFPALRAAVEAGLARKIPMGHEVSFVHATEGTLTYEVVDYDAYKDSLTLLQTTTLADQTQFDPPEALYSPIEEMPAGNYTFKHNNVNYYFALTEPVPADGQIRATTTGFTTYASPYESVAIESGTVDTTVLEAATSIGTTATGLLNHMDRVTYGSNDYGESALGMWLNSTGDAWWMPQTRFMRPHPLSASQGFLTGVPQDVIDALDDATIEVGTNTTYVAPDSKHTKGGVYTVTQKFFLPSQNNMYDASDVADGGRQYKYFIGQPDSTKIRKYGTTARFWWLRSPHTNAYNVRSVHTNGSSRDYNAYSTRGVVPACRISKSL